METILSIEDVDNGNNREGYKVTTNKQVITIYISNKSDCYKFWGHFSTKDYINEFIGAALLAINRVDIVLKVTDAIPNCEYGGDVMFLNIKTNRGTLQFVL